ncbi:hypothetical protein LEP1GSC059_1277 [Leptospira noguchii serovar Panama str. CZ214]|uniref:Uncharacterized protein n=1 Tax=Leptospira noguchii serovar Panama str. CZ214 TaxID=1001595 RepID=T0FM35_9LEPT|nr:hypothetical protein LEP1GSC059_1277 [Leptospira noguchii serovar Panama str. CZ214]
MKPLSNLKSVFFQLIGEQIRIGGSLRANWNGNCKLASG